jgi:pimeloyl-ACP methyl ester carboxylesterase
MTTNSLEVTNTAPSAPSTRTPDDEAQERPYSPVPGSTGHIGWVVAGSLATGLVAAALLVAAPFIPAEANDIVGAVLCGFALGWAMLAVLSERLTDRPQRWAAAPALFMAFGGLLLLVFGSSVGEALSWVWPPALLVLVIWMIVRARQHLHGWSRRGLLYPVIAMLAVASVGGGYETVSAATDAELSMPGQLIDVGGHRLHLSCTGSGSPTVVVEPGAGGMSSDLGLVTPAVARDTRVCVYDRAGRGWSDPADTTQDANQIATDLNTLLRRADVPGPYVLAGHSFGGLYTLTFAAHYPEQVAGMVLVDTTAPAAEPVTATPEDAGSSDFVSRLSILASTSARLGLGRLIGVTESHLRSTIDEYLLANTLTGQAAALTDLGDKPLVVLTAGDGSDATWIQRHEDLSRLSTNSVHRVIDGATHATVIADERDSAATTQAILDAVSSVRNARPLPR